MSPFDGGPARTAPLVDPFGRTIDYVIQHAPCEVLINLVPLEGVYAAAGADGTDTPGSDQA